MHGTERPFAPEDRPARKASIHGRDLGGERVVYEPDSHQVVVLNATAAWILDQCDGSRTVAEILAAFAKRFVAPRDVLERDLLATLQHLYSKSLVG